MNYEKRLILAFVLSITILLAYQGYASKYSNKTKIDIPKPSSVLLKETANIENQNTAQSTTTRPEQGPASTIINALYKVVLSEQTAAIKELYLLGQRFGDKSGNPASLLKSTTNMAYSLELIDIFAEDKELSWRKENELGDKITYVSENNNKKITKYFEFHKDNYIIELTVTTQSKIDAVQDMGYKVIGSSGIVVTKASDAGYVIAEVLADENKSYIRKPSHKSIKGGENFPGPIKLVVAKNRHFSFILKPYQSGQTAFIECNDRQHIFTGVIVGPVKLGPKERIEHKFIFYAGPSSPENIKELGEQAVGTINYGTFNAIAVFIFNILIFFYKIFGNFGVAVIMLSLFISAILFPLTKKSLNSMKEMQRIQPEIEKIKKECGDNAAKMNKEIMELYKKHKINPMGGCLPMFLQFPIFIALYQVLMRSVALKGAGFLWVKDLTEPDCAFKIPVAAVGRGDYYINILPLLMVAAMVVQQKMSQQKNMEASEQQRIMMMVFPVFIGFIFYNMPAGLVLYWLINTVSTIFLQEIVLKSVAFTK